jgi:hypothetical protein
VSKNAQVDLGFGVQTQSEDCQSPHCSLYIGKVSLGVSYMIRIHVSHK